MNKFIGLLAFVALAWWWTSTEALTPTSRFGIRYAPADTLRVSGTARVDSLDSLLVGGRAVGSMVWQDTAWTFIKSLSASAVGIGVPTESTRPLWVRGDSAVSSTVARFEISNLNSYSVTQMANIAPAHTGNYSSFEARMNSTAQERTAFAFRSRLSDITDATRTSSIELWSNDAGAFAKQFMFVGPNFGIGAAAPDSTLDVTGSGRFSTNLRVAGVVHIGDNADSAAAHDLAVQSGTAFSRLDAGEETFEVTSDEALKTNFEAVNTAAIRQATLALPPPRQWQYRTEALRHEPHLALIRADSSRAAVEREVDERLAQEEQDGRTLDRATVAAEIRAARTAAVVEQAAAYLQQVERRAAVKHTGWTAQELYPLAQVIRPATASPTSTRLTDRVIGLVVTTQAQQDEIDDLKAAVYDPELGGVPLVTYVLGLAALVAALSGYVATLKKQVNDLEARIAAMEGVAPNPPNPETEREP